MVAQEAGHSCVYAVINALYVYIKDPIPGAFLHLAHETHMDDACVADQDIYAGNLRKGCLDSGAVCHIAADGFRAGGFCHGFGSFVFLFIKEVNPVTLGSEQLHSCGADTTAAAGNDNSRHIIFFCSWSGGRNTAGWKRSCCQTRS